MPLVMRITAKIFLVFGFLCFNAASTLAYPTSFKWWVLPFAVEGSSDTALGENAAQYVKAALVSTYEGGQQLMTDEEVLLAIALTGTTRESALADNNWITKVARAAKVTWVLRGKVTVNGSSATVVVAISTQALSESRWTETGDLSSLPALSIRAIRILLFRADHFWAWTKILPPAAGGHMDARLISAIGDLGSERYPSAIQRLQEISPILHGRYSGCETQYWTVQAYALAGVSERAKNEGQKFMKFCASAPRAKNVRAQLLRDPVKGTVPDRDH